MADPSAVRPTWSTAGEAVGVIAFRPHLRRSVAVALAVGSVLFVINQLDVVLSGKATTGVYVKGALTFLVPFCVSNYGILVATRRPREGP